MPHNILLTGAAGYVGGSVLADLLKTQADELKDTKILAAVRSRDQVELLADLPVTGLQLDIADKTRVLEVVLENEVDIVVHAAGVVDSRMVENLIGALGERRKRTGNETYFVHTSVLTMFTPEAGWSYGAVKDTDSRIPEREEAIGGKNPARNSNIIVAREGKANNVAVVNIALPLVYGRGSGRGRKISVALPAFIRTNKKLATAHTFEQNNNQTAIHISDLTDLYVRIIIRILKGESSLASGDTTYYFAFAHHVSMGKTNAKLAQHMHARGMVTDPVPKVWSSWDVAADNLGFPRALIKAMATNEGDLSAVNPYTTGWKPTWGEEDFMKSLDQEITDVEELDTVKMSLFDSLVSGASHE